MQSKCRALILSTKYPIKYFLKMNFPVIFLVTY